MNITSENSSNQERIEKEISYLLQIRKNELTSYSRKDDNLLSGLKLMMSPDTHYLFNEKVMVVLLETGYIQRELEKDNEILFHSFLKYLLEENK